MPQAHHSDGSVDYIPPRHDLYSTVDRDWQTGHETGLVRLQCGCGWHGGAYPDSHAGRESEEGRRHLQDAARTAAG